VGALSAPPTGPAQVKGQLLIARFDYLREAHDMHAVARVLDSLSPEDRDRVRGLVRDRWYPFALLLRLDHALVQVIAGGDQAFFEELGRASARHRTEWLGEHAALVNVHAFLSRVADEHRRFHDFGRAAYRRTGFHSSDMTFCEYPELDPAFCLASRGYFLGVLELLLGRPGEVHEVACQCAGDPACVFRLDWRRAAAPDE
jgi:predicted hydrocarbon binding protein